MKRFHL